MNNLIQQNKKIKIAKYIIITFLIILFSLIILSLYTNDFEHNVISLEINEKKIHTLVSDTPESRSNGLSIFDMITDNDAMLFIFDKPGYYNFWMKEMKFPIDIVWLDKYKNIVFIKENALPDDYPDIYKPKSPSLYVLEFKSGFVKKNNLSLGDHISFTY